MAGGNQLLVVTDLDGSLLDNSYDWSAALPALDRLRTAGIPLVLNSSKTVEEMLDLAAELDMRPPLVAENGALIALPDPSGAYRTELTGPSRAFILEAAHALRKSGGYRFSGFADWTTGQVARCTGLSPAAARRSQLRHATEPILWDDTEARLFEFQNALAVSDIRILRGGRFLHLMGQADKADGMAAVLRKYREAHPGTNWTVIALGDSENDRAMLEAADIAVVIPHTEGVRIAPQAPRMVVAPAPASQGWNAALLELLDEQKEENS
jgi:mannosyl-3-phosphoglycerate phosphatase